MPFHSVASPPRIPHMWTAIASPSLRFVLVLAVFLCPSVARAAGPASRPAHPNIVFVIADQWRACSTGYAGDPNVKTPAAAAKASNRNQLGGALPRESCSSAVRPASS